MVALFESLWICGVGLCNWNGLGEMYNKAQTLPNKETQRHNQVAKLLMKKLYKLEDLE